MADNIRKPKILILGRGFLGLHLAERLRSAGHDVSTFSKSRHPRFKTVQDLTGDFTQLSQSSPLFDTHFDLIFHLISTTTPSSSDKDPSFDTRSNLLSTIDFLNRLHSPEKTKVVFVSSAGTVYGPRSESMTENSSTDPICSYGVTKLAIEKHLALTHKKRGLDYLVLRVSNPYGIWAQGHAPFGIINCFVDNLTEGKKISLFGDLDTERDFIAVEDLIDAIQTVSFSEASKKLYNVSYGKSHSLAEILSILKENFGPSMSVEHQPARGFDLKHVRIDHSLFANEFSWKPKIDLKTGIRRLITQRQRQNKV